MINFLIIILQKLILNNEIEIMRHLDHPNIIKIYNVYETEIAIMFVMQLIKGGTLSNRLKNSNDL